MLGHLWQVVFGLVRDIVVATGLAKKDLAEVFIQEAVDHEVHHAVQNQE